MAYDEELANRVRELVGREAGLTEQRMFGGLAMLVNRNMAVAVRSDSVGGLLVRVDPDRDDEALAEPGAALMVMRGREMPGWITVTAEAVARKADLRRWVDRGLTYARSLPAK
ncbi:TfoX/Sxy family protein [Longispora sp. K20-0274]|uniref:TfoX/Sxy family protein n=1 Tax=Longispora sp. K20-0274 TaxID=3088255 RepID=UPI00399A79CD